MTVALPAPDDATGVFSVIGYAFDAPSDEQTVHIGRYGGEVESTYGFADYPLLAKVVSHGIGLHEGRSLGLWSFWGSAPMCLAVIFMCVSGPLMWWRRRPRRTGQLGAPRGRMPLKATPLLAAALVALGLFLPLFGVTLLAALAARPAGAAASARAGRVVRHDLTSGEDGAVATLGRESEFPSGDFTRFWWGETVSSVGTYVTLVALPTLVVLTLDGTAQDVGWLNSARWLPYLLLGLVVGALVDRHRRRPVMVVTDLARAALLVSIPWRGRRGCCRCRCCWWSWPATAPRPSSTTRPRCPSSPAGAARAPATRPCTHRRRRRRGPDRRPGPGRSLGEACRSPARDPGRRRDVPVLGPHRPDDPRARALARSRRPPERVA